MASDGSVIFIDRPTDVEGVYASLCRGAPYAYRDSVARGYIPLESGVRVGVAGRARYDGGRLVGIGEVSSLVFRIPTGRCDFANEIYAICKDTAGGVLIFSPPGGGKTTALRSLARSLSRDRRVVIVDEREEIYTDELLDREIDVLSGYRRGYGISLATRSLSPDVILTDEISAEDATEVLLAANSGVPIIATAHAASVAELMRREGMRRLFECGVFGSAVGIYRSLGGFFCREESVEGRA
jgi:stage III sporulation protein AA